MYDAYGVRRPAASQSSLVVPDYTYESTINSSNYNGRVITPSSDNGSGDHGRTNIGDSLKLARKRRKVSHPDPVNASSPAREPEKKQCCWWTQQPKTLEELKENVEKDGFLFEDVAIGYKVEEFLTSDGAKNYRLLPEKKEERIAQLKVIIEKYSKASGDQVYSGISFGDVVIYTVEFINTTIEWNKNNLKFNSFKSCEIFEEVDWDGPFNPLTWIRWVGNALKNKPYDKRVRLAAWWLDFAMLSQFINRQSTFSVREYIDSEYFIERDMRTDKRTLIEAIVNAYDQSSTFIEVARFRDRVEGYFKPNGGFLFLVARLKELSAFVDANPELARTYINWKDYNNNTALHLAASKGLYYYFHYLIQAGADIRQEKETTSFHHALTAPDYGYEKNYFNCLSTLVLEVKKRYGIPYLKEVINKRSRIKTGNITIKQTVLHYALSELFTGLTRQGGRLNSPGCRGVTFAELKSIVHYLVKWGADPDKEDNAQKKAWDYVDCLPYGRTERTIIRQVLSSPDKLEVIEADVIEYLLTSQTKLRNGLPKPVSRVLVIPCINQWQFTEVNDGLISAISVLLNLYQIDLMALMAAMAQKVSRKSVVSIELPENNLFLSHVIIFPVEVKQATWKELTSQEVKQVTMEKHRSQYQDARREILKLAKTQKRFHVLFTTVALSQHYSMEGIDQDLDGFKVCAESAIDFSAGYGLTVLCKPDSNAKLTLNQYGLNDGPVRHRRFTGSEPLQGSNEHDDRCSPLEGMSGDTGVDLLADHIDINDDDGLTQFIMSEVVKGEAEILLSEALQGSNQLNDSCSTPEGMYRDKRVGVLKNPIDINGDELYRHIMGVESSNRFDFKSYTTRLIQLSSGSVNITELIIEFKKGRTAVLRQCTNCNNKAEKKQASRECFKQLFNVIHSWLQFTDLRFQLDENFRLFTRIKAVCPTSMADRAYGEVAVK